MRKTSSIRIVDDLGRIVVPKEMREKLHLVSGSSVDVFMQGDEIVITKHSVIKNISQVAQMCIDCFEDFNEYFIFICDTQNVIAKNKKMDNGLKIPKELFNVLTKGEIKILHQNQIISLNEEQFSSEAIFPILASGEVVGGLVILSKKYTENFDFAKSMFKFLQKYLNFV